MTAVYSGNIVDGHCHIASTRFIPRAFYEGLCRNVAARLAATGVKKSLSDLLDMYVKLSQDHEGDTLIQEMDSAGIAQAVLLLPDFSHVMESELTIAEKARDWAAE